MLNTTKLVNNLGLVTARGGARSRIVKPRKPKETKTLLESALELAPEPTPEIKPVLISRGMHFEYNGEYNAESIIKIMTKLQLLVEGEENQFNLAISLTERA
jgi:hypothetical protein